MLLTQILAPRVLRHASGAALVFFALVTVLGLVRVLPFAIAEGHISPHVLTFTLRASLELALVLGAPVGFARGAAEFVDRGELAAVEAAGVRLLDFARAAALPVTAVAFLAGSAAELRASDLAEPGRLAGAVLSDARARCASKSERGAAVVPVSALDVAWLCAEREEPLAVGLAAGAPAGAPSSRARVVYAARALDYSADLSRLDLRSAEALAFAGATIESSAARIHASELSLQLPPAAAMPLRAPSARPFIAGATAALAALLALLAVLAQRVASPALALAYAATACVPAQLVQSALDRAGAGAAAYVWVPLSALAGLAIGVRTLGWAFANERPGHRGRCVARSGGR